jgi:hypothetical protein
VRAELERGERTPVGRPVPDLLPATYCFLDDDPAAVGERLRPVLAERWAAAGVEPLLAAPYHAIVAYDWGRFRP